MYLPLAHPLPLPSPPYHILLPPPILRLVPFSFTSNLAFSNSISLGAFFVFSSAALCFHRLLRHHTHTHTHMCSCMCIGLLWFPALSLKTFLRPFVRLLLRPWDFPVQIARLKFHFNFPNCCQREHPEIIDWGEYYPFTLFSSQLTPARVQVTSTDRRDSWVPSFSSL